MMDQLIAIKDKIVAFWNKYTTRQKTIIICVVLAVFFALVLLSYFLTRPVYTHLATFSDAGLANTLSEALEGTTPMIFLGSIFTTVLPMRSEGL